MSDIGNNLTFARVVYAYAPPTDMSNVIEKPADYADSDLASYIQSNDQKLCLVDSNLSMSG